MNEEVHCWMQIRVKQSATIPAQRSSGAGVRRSGRCLVSVFFSSFLCKRMFPPANFVVDAQIKEASSK